MVVGVVVVVVGGTWVMVNVASQFSGGSATSSGSLTLIEHWLEGASPCTVMLRSAVTSVAPMFMVLELMVIYCAQVASTSITSLSRSVGVSSMTSVLVKVTITSRVSSCTPDTLQQNSARWLMQSSATVVVVVGSTVVVVGSTVVGCGFDR